MSTTRDRLIMAMADALQTRGYHGVGLNEILSTAEAPKGVLYHHFPGGKTDLAIAAIGSAVTAIQKKLEQLVNAAAGDPVKGLRSWLVHAEKTLAKSQYERGCPLATVALESTADDGRLRLALAQAFDDIRQQLTRILSEAGIAEKRARQLSTLIISAYEGSLIQARVADSSLPVSETIEPLLELLQFELQKGKVEP